jgi:3-hydroxyisobutyrate dehydrogenase
LPNEAQRRVGVIGLGNLGAAMAAALCDAGWQVLGYDREPGRAAQVHPQLRAVEEPTELAACSVIAVVVPDDATVEEVLLGSGLLDRVATDPADERLVAIHSTILPTTAVRIGKRAEQMGVALVDAPVSGGAERARAGTLTAMVGGSDKAVRVGADYFDAISSTLIHIGALGSAAAAKLGNQLMMFAALASTYEALELGAAYGASAEKVLEATRTSTGDSWVAREWGFFDKTADDYDRSGVPLRSRPWSKDLWDVVAAARESDLQLPVAGLLAQLLPERVEAHAAHAREARA